MMAPVAKRADEWSDKDAVEQFVTAEERDWVLRAIGSHWESAFGPDVVLCYSGSLTDGDHVQLAREHLGSRGADCGGVPSISRFISVPRQRLVLLLRCLRRTKRTTMNATATTAASSTSSITSYQ